MALGHGMQSPGKARTDAIGVQAAAPHDPMRGSLLGLLLQLLLAWDPGSVTPAHTEEPRGLWLRVSSSGMGQVPRGTCGGARAQGAAGEEPPECPQPDLLSRSLLGLC